MSKKKHSSLVLRVHVGLEPTNSGSQVKPPNHLATLPPLTKRSVMPESFPVVFIQFNTACGTWCGESVVLSVVLCVV